jgi:hypothetical protein
MVAVETVVLWFAREKGGRDQIGGEEGETHFSAQKREKRRGSQSQ